MNLREFNEGKATEMTMHNTPTARFLMCRPRHFAVTYSINPWMNPAAWQESGDALHATAQQQWDGLFHALGSSGASVELVEPRSGLPDLVFTANSAVVLDGKALLARFRYPQRQGEELGIDAAGRDRVHERPPATSRTTLPTVRRASRSSCARRTSDSV